jgi:hypothetical protein
MAVIPLRRARGLGAIVTPGTSVYPSQDGTFAIVRGTGAHYGNGLIDGWLIAGAQADGYYALDDNNTGSIVDEQTVGRKYKIGSEYDAFVNSTPTSPEYLAWLVLQRQQQEQANPKLKAYDDALRAWAQSQQPPVAVDPVYGFATNFSMDAAPLAVQQAYAAFTGNPIPEPPPPPPGPNIYLQGGFAFDDSGNLYDGTGKVIAGVKLTSAEVASLLSTGHLPAGDAGPYGSSSSSSSPPRASSPPASSSSSTPPTTQTSSSAPATQTGGASDGSTPGTAAGASTGGGSTGLNLPSGTSAVDVSGGGGGAPMAVAADGSPAAAAPSSSSMGWGLGLLLAAGIAGAAILSTRRR